MDFDFFGIISRGFLRASESRFRAEWSFRKYMGRRSGSEEFAIVCSSSGVNGADFVKNGVRDGWKTKINRKCPALDGAWNRRERTIFPF